MKSKLLFLALFIVMTLSIIALTAHASTLTVVHADSATSHLQKRTQDQYTINWYDKTGHIVKTWLGSRSEAEKIEQVERAKHHVQLPLNTSSSEVTPNVNIVSPCYLPNDFFDFFSVLVECFANKGAAPISVNGVSEVASGNNHGRFQVVVCNDNSINCTGPININIGYRTADFPINGDYWNATYLDILPA